MMYRASFVSFFDFLVMVKMDNCCRMYSALFTADRKFTAAISRAGRLCLGQNKYPDVFFGLFSEPFAAITFEWSARL